jgi:hypothetical protein
LGEIEYLPSESRDELTKLRDDALELLTDAPTWASVKQVKGRQVLFGAFVPGYEWQVKCNYKDDFEWEPDMVIHYRNLLLKVDTIVEAVRFREVVMTANVVDNARFVLPSV